MLSTDHAACLSLDKLAVQERSVEGECLQGSVRIYKIPLPPDIEDRTITGADPRFGLFQGLPSNDPVKVLVRVYIVKVSLCMCVGLLFICWFAVCVVVFLQLSHLFP